MPYPITSATHADASAIASGGWRVTRAQAKAARDITRIRIRGAVVTARETTKVEAIADVAEVAIVSSSQVSRLASLYQDDPYGHEGRQLITKSTSAAMADVVFHTGRNL